MLADCIEKMSRQSCGTCDRRDDCAFVWPEAIGFALARRRGSSRPQPERGGRRLHPFVAFLGDIAGRIEARSKPRATPLRDEVERRLEPLLATGEIRVDAVARELGLSRQTLYRRLKAEGATFEGILDGLRRRLALRYVRDRGMAVKEAAWRLGFSDPAAFSRAFKRWTGRSPGGARGPTGQPG